MDCSHRVTTLRLIAQTGQPMGKTLQTISGPLAELLSKSQLTTGGQQTDTTLIGVGREFL